MESVLSVTKTLLGKSRLSPAGSTGEKQALSSRFNWEKAGSLQQVQLGKSRCVPVEAKREASGETWQVRPVGVLQVR